MKRTMGNHLSSGSDISVRNPHHRGSERVSSAAANKHQSIKTVLEFGWNSNGEMVGINLRRRIENCILILAGFQPQRIPAPKSRPIDIIPVEGLDIALSEEGKILNLNYFLLWRRRFYLGIKCSGLLCRQRIIIDSRDSNISIPGIGCVASTCISADTEPMSAGRGRKYHISGSVGCPFQLPVHINI